MNSDDEKFLEDVHRKMASGTIGPIDIGRLITMVRGRDAKLIELWNEKENGGDEFVMVQMRNARISALESALREADEFTDRVRNCSNCKECNKASRAAREKIREVLG